MKKRKAWITIVIAVVLFIILTGAAWKYHEQPQFCAICHIMEPYLESWKTTPSLAFAHAQENVDCLDCHEPSLQEQMEEGIKFITNDYENPLHERSFNQEWCYRCHEHGSEEELIQRTSDSRLNPHESHYDQMECNICHKVHREQQDFCAQCHKQVVKEPGWIMPISPSTQTLEWWNPDMDCEFCHDMVPLTETMEDPDLLVFTHAQEGLECQDCHEDSLVKQIHEDTKPDTPAVHRYKTPNENCFDCHISNEHTNYEEIIERTTDYMVLGENINPHDPHEDVVGVEGSQLEEYDCYRCHSMHTESDGINFCWECHHDYTYESCDSPDCHGDLSELNL